MRINLIRDGGISISSLPKSGVQKVLLKTLDQLRKHVTKTDDTIVFHTVSGDVTFRILYPPGAHCLTCGETFSDHPLMTDEKARKARAHVKRHGEKAVTTDRWPHGYLVARNHYVCEVVE